MKQKTEKQTLEKRIQTLEVQQKALLIFFFIVLACFLWYTINHEKIHEALVEFNNNVMEFSDKVNEVLLLVDERILELEEEVYETNERGE